jgi:hypothetical protein
LENPSNDRSGVRGRQLGCALLDPALGRVHGLLEKRVLQRELPAGLFDLLGESLAIGDVKHRTDHANGLTNRIALDLRLLLDPAQLAVRAQNPMFDAVLDPFFEGAPHRLANERPVLRMHGLEEVVVRHLDASGLVPENAEDLVRPSKRVPVQVVEVAQVELPETQMGDALSQHQRGTLALQPFAVGGLGGLVFKGNAHIAHGPLLIPDGKERGRYRDPIPFFDMHLGQLAGIVPNGRHRHHFAFERPPNEIGNPVLLGDLVLQNVVFGGRDGSEEFGERSVGEHRGPVCAKNLQAEGRGPEKSGHKLAQIRDVGDARGGFALVWVAHSSALRRRSGLVGSLRL